MKCVAKGCNSYEQRQRRLPGVSFHRFPKNRFVAVQWLRALNLKNFMPIRRDVVCSLHFDPENFSTNSIGKKILKPNAIPLYEQVEIVESSTIAKLETVENSSNSPEYVTEYLYSDDEILEETIEYETTNNFETNEDADGDPSTGQTERNLEVRMEDQTLAKVIPESPNSKRPKFDDSNVTLKRLKVEELVVFTGNIPTTSKPNQLAKNVLEIVTNVVNESKNDQKYVDPEREEKAFEINRKLFKSKTTIRNKIKNKHKKPINLVYSLNLLRENNLITEEVDENLKNVLRNAYNEYIVMEQMKISGRNSCKKFPPQLRNFALHLNFFAPKGYEFLCKKFKNVFPHQRDISRWSKNSKFYPGFTIESFDYLENAANEVERRGGKIILQLMFDEMKIHEKLEIDGGKTFGYVDFGMGCESEEIAEKVLVFMAVAINESWKIPLGYFPIRSISAAQKKNLIFHCVENLLATGVTLLGLSFNGNAENSVLEKLLQANLVANSETVDDSEGFQLDDSAESYIIHPDPFHMIKLICNTFADVKVIYNRKQEPIKYDYVQKLIKVQEQDEYNAIHEYFSKKKINVKLAFSLFNESILEAIEYCRNTLRLGEFLGSKPTVEFLRIFSIIFNIFTSRDIYEFGYKRAMYVANYVVFQNFSLKAIKYIAGLRNASGELLISSSRKTGFLGLIKCLKNLSKIYEKFLITERLSYIPFHKMSTVHLEQFFASVELQSGLSRTLTVKQFRRTYQRIIQQCRSESGGIKSAVPFDEFINSGNGDFVLKINRTVEKFVLIKYDFLNRKQDLNSADDQFLRKHEYLLNLQYISEFQDEVCNNISGFVVLQLSKSLLCSECISLILDGKLGFKTLISYSWIPHPSRDVIKICRTTERFIKMYQHQDEFHVNHFTLRIINLVQESLLNTNLFESQIDHTLQNNHYILLLKAICERYLYIRKFYIRKCGISKKYLKQKILDAIHQENIFDDDFIV